MNIPYKYKFLLKFFFGIDSKGLLNIPNKISPYSELSIYLE